MSKDIIIDFSDVQSEDFAPIPKQKYLCTVYDVSLTEADSGNSMVVWTFKVFAGKYKGRQLWMRTTIVSQSLWKLKQVLERLGVPLQGKIKINQAFLNKTKGKKCYVVVGTQKYQGDLRNTVENVLTYSQKEEILGEEGTGEEESAINVESDDIPPIDEDDDMPF